MSWTVGIAVENYFVAGPDLALALVRAVAAVPGWQPFLVRGAGSDVRELRSRLGCADAVICCPQPGEMHRAVAGRPAVALFGTAPGLPAVLFDNRSLGRAAARQLLTGGCRSLVWLGAAAGEITQQRHAGVVEIATRHQIGVTILPDSEASLAPLQRLPGPVGVVAYNDIFGARLVQRCMDAGLPVPEAIQVIGIDDDVLACHGCRPALSSVGLPWAAVATAAVR